jgi:hypothetical protein
MTTQILNYAFIDKNGTVINICVFEEKNDDLIQQIKLQLGAEIAIPCEEFGIAVINGKWNGQHFLFEDGSRVPPTIMPSDPNFRYEYDWDINDWIVAGPVKYMLGL